MNKIQYFLEEAYDKLWDQVKTNSEKYLSAEDWLDTYFAGQEYMKESTIDVLLPEVVPFLGRLTVDQRTIEDIANVKQIYGNMRALTPLQATNQYMWTCLAHTVYKEYVLHRWFDDEKFDALSDEKKVKRIISRFFATSNERSLNNNAIARLWWYGYISYDVQNRSNPFHLTEVLVSNTKFCTDFMQSHCCWNRAVGKGVLRAVADLIPQLGKSEGISGYYRRLKKYLNRYGAVTSLDFLNEEDIYNLSMEYLQKQRKNAPIEGDDPDEADLDFEG